MNKIKLIVETDIETFEKKVNDFLSEHNIIDIKYQSEEYSIVLRGIVDYVHHYEALIIYK